MKTFFVGLLALLTLNACANSDITYSSLPEALLAQKPGMAQIIIYRPTSFKYILRSLQVELGHTPCELQSGSFLLYNAPPSPLRITATLWGVPGASRIMFEPKDAQRYYIKLAVDSDKFNAAAMGEDDMIVPRSSMLSDHSGPFDIKVMDEKTALTELQSLKMSGPCP